MHASVDDLVPHSLMGLMGDVVVDDGIRAHLDAVVTAGPVLCLLDQFSADSAFAKLGSHVPTLDVSDRLCWITPIGVRAQIDFDEAHQSAVFGLSDQDGDRHGQNLDRVPTEKQLEFFCMLFGARLRPQGGQHRRQVIEIGKLGGSDVNVTHDYTIVKPKR